MAVKLLTKKDITSLKNKERQNEIQEGVKLASRVDNLRVIQAEEEASLMAFRKKTVAAIKGDIDEELFKRDTLRSEVAELEQKQALGMKYVFKAMKDVEQEKMQILAEKADLNKREVALSAFEHVTRTDRSRLLVDMQILDEKRKGIEAIAKNAFAEMEAAQTAVHKATALEAQAVTLRKTTEAELRTRDAVVAAKERDLKNWETRLTSTEAALRKQEIQLNDREKTLEREFNRLNKK